MSLLERIDTVCLVVSDIEKAKEWYGEKLGLKIIFQEGNYAVLGTGSSNVPLTIEECEISAQPFNIPNLLHIEY